MNLLEKLNKAARREQLLAWLQIVLGCVIGAAAYPLFLDPGKIAPGGLTGVAMILKHLWGWDIGITSLILNIPLFIVGYKAMGRLFAFRSLVATILFSLMIDLLPLKAIPVEPILGTCTADCCWALVWDSSCAAAPPPAVRTWQPAWCTSICPSCRWGCSCS